MKSKLIYATSDENTDELYLVEKGIHDEQIRIVNAIQVTKDLNLRFFIKGGAEIVEPLFLPAEESA